MSVYGSGAAAMPQWRARGAVDTPVTNKWQGQMLDARDAIRAKYSRGEFTAAEMLRDVDHWWQIASKFANEAGDVSTVRPDQIKRAKDNATDLLEARAELRVRQPAAVLAETDVRRYVNAMTAPVDWLISVGTPSIAERERESSTLKKVLWIAAGLAGVWAVTRLLDSGVQAKREIWGKRPIIQAPRKLVVNPPAWAADPELWEHARVAVESNGAEYDNPMAVTTHVYKQLGGRVS